MKKSYFSIAFFVAGILIFTGSGFTQDETPGKNEFQTVPLQSQITHVQPMTGIVLWEQLNKKDTDAIQMEYSYMRYNDVVKEKGVFDWTVVEQKLNSAASRSHQSILRFWDTYPGRESSVPDYIKALPDYKNIVAKSENRDTGFPDWSHPEYQRFFLEFYQKFAEKYDHDPRLAFLETGFGLWSEYHIYDPEEIPGKNFPGLDFQAKYFRHLDTLFQETPWMISQDAHPEARSPFAGQPDLLNIKFGIFDDSFHLAWKPGYNYEGWEFFGLKRYEESPAGGEILFPNQERSDYVDSNWTKESRRFGITFMICEQWLRWITIDRLRQHSMDCGYKFKVTDFKTSDNSAIVTVQNTGVAPIYYDAFVTVNGVRSTESLKYLQAGESRLFHVQAGGKNPKLTIECDRLVPGQKIEYDADIK
ncbi:DUF4832 domain-containing protein [candidate division KSB1 bacterium]|nr:DUF4832 domain-containing protein [candidate division KSB1 bacterium]